tara:strand:+ start:16985 stop:17884 length:900 start_codon:yes stop_codon:yes gene_type:complete
MSLKKRWFWWRERRKIFPPDDIHRAGELAEMRLAKLSRAAGKENGWKIYESVRIPDPDGGRREIDLVIIGGNQILIVEQKHWSGSFVINSKHQFIQTRNKGGEHNHDGVADRIARKSRLLLALHNKRLNIENGPEVRVIVAMTHYRLDWPEIPDNLAAEMVDEQGMLEILKKVSPGEINPDLVETLEGFNTWDEVHLNGGLMLKGDVHSLGLGESIDEIFSNRREKVTGDVTHKKSVFSIFDKQPSSGKLIIDKKNIECKLPYGINLVMHVVGQKERREVPWSQISKLNISKPPAEWNK